MLAGMRAASQLRIFATLLVLVAWVVVVRGLYYTSPSPRPELDLEGGGGFAANLEVYLPSMGITLLLLALLSVGLFARHVGSLAAAMAGGLTLAFGFWVLTRRYLLDYLPALDLHLWFNIGLSAIAILIAVLAGLTYREASQAPAS